MVSDEDWTAFDVAWSTVIFVSDDFNVVVLEISERGLKLIVISTFAGISFIGTSINNINKDLLNLKGIRFF